MKGKFESSLVVGVLQVIAVAMLLAGVILLIAAFAGRRQDNAMAYAGALGLVSGLFVFALASICDAVQEAATNSRLGIELIEKLLGAPAPAREPAKEAPLLTTQTQRALSERFYVERPGGEQQGPMDFGKVRDLVAAGVIDAETKCWREGDEEWKEVRDFL